MTEGRRPSQATIVAWVALFVALGGVASGLPGQNTVNSRDIKPEAVRKSDINQQAVGTTQLRDGGIAETDIAPDAVGTSRLAPGAVTPAKVGTTPAARVYVPQQAAACSDQVIEHNSSEELQFSVELFDTQDLHADPASGCPAGTQSRLTAPIDGIYVVSAGVSWPSDNTANRRRIEIRRTNDGGPQTMARDSRAAVTGENTTQEVSTILDLDAADSVEARVSQDSGSPLTLSGSLETYLSIAWVAPQS
jgi:hypothetical protein